MQPSISSAVATLLLLTLTACGGGTASAGGTTTPPPNTPPTTTLRQVATPHGITVGAAADSFYLSDPNYASILGSEFSQLEPENEMKFAVVHPSSGTYDFSGADALVAFAQTHNLLVRGHTLVWYQQVPPWVTGTPTQLSAILQDHINTVMGHYAGKAYAWDVVNEAFNDDGTMRSTLWFDSPGIGYAGMGTQYIEQSLQWAHAADPNAKLFYNDYNGETLNSKSDAIYRMAQDFKTRSVPLDGIGFQMHLTLGFDTPANLASLTSNFQRFAALGLTLHITEMDVRLPDASTASLTAQAHLYGEIAAICRQQPACKLVQTWGFTDLHSWISGTFPGMGFALPWDASYQKKPAYTSLHDALAQ